MSAAGRRMSDLLFRASEEKKRKALGFLVACLSAERDSRRRVARGGYARAARERAPAKATRRDRPTPRPSGRPWTSARWQSTMRCFSAACLSARSNDPRPVRGASVSTHRSWRRDRRPPPGTRADAAAQTPTGATPRRCARSKSEGRVTHRTSTGSSFNTVMFTAVADIAELLTLGRRGDVPEWTFRAPAWKKSWRRANAPQRPALASFSRGTP